MKYSRFCFIHRLVILYTDQLKGTTSWQIETKCTSRRMSQRCLSISFCLLAVAPSEAPGVPDVVTMTTLSPAESDLSAFSIRLHFWLVLLPRIGIIGDVPWNTSEFQSGYRFCLGTDPAFTFSFQSGALSFIEVCRLDRRKRINNAISILALILKYSKFAVQWLNTYWEIIF